MTNHSNFMGILFHFLQKFYNFTKQSKSDTELIEIKEHDLGLMIRRAAITQDENKTI